MHPALVFTAVATQACGRGLVTFLLTVLLTLGAGHQLAQAESLATLSVSQLQQRLDQPVKREGQQVVDLRHVQLDLQDEPFRQAFYSRTQAALQTGTAPLGLDLTGSLIEGDLDLAQLGLRTPRLANGLDGLLPDAARQQIALDRLGEARLSLDTSLDARYTPISVFRGRLSLAETTVMGQVNANETYFLGPWSAENAVFTDRLTAQRARFLGRVSAAATQFQQTTDFTRAIFFEPAVFDQAQFSGAADFTRSEFRDGGRFAQAHFQATATFRRSYWQGAAHLDQSQFSAPLSFAKAQFASALTLAETVLRESVSFRQAQFGQAVNLRGARLQQQVDFGDAQFAGNAILNVPDLEFDAQTARILGTQLGQQFSVPALTGNEAVLKNLIRNFRQLEQIADANQVTYTLERLRLRQLAQRLRAVNLNRASPLQLSRLGLAAEQIQAILDYRQNTAFVRPAELLRLPAIGATDYWRVSDRIITETTPSLWQQGLLATRWLGLGLLLVLSRYGTSVGLVFGVGWLVIAPFALAYWWLDRDRTEPLLLWHVIPPLSTYLGLVTLGLALIYRSGPTPGATILVLTLLVVPAVVLASHQLGQQRPDEPSYFNQDGSERQLRLLIARLPVMPNYYFYRNRYTGLVRSRHWNWLNYFDFSVNNSLRFGFNDTRLRDVSVPGGLSLMVWYQWTLGVLYIALLLWTLSRAIPGLNLLLYF
ncbi:MAG: pentapeptide repeat-containing protein [Cyanobacteria bacterium P01_A01_bin.105]